MTYFLLALKDNTSFVSFQVSSLRLVFLLPLWGCLLSQYFNFNFKNIYRYLQKGILPLSPKVFQLTKAIAGWDVKSCHPFIAIKNSLVTKVLTICITGFWKVDYIKNCWRQGVSYFFKNGNAVMLNKKLKLAK